MLNLKVIFLAFLTAFITFLLKLYLKSEDLAGFIASLFQTRNSQIILYSFGFIFASLFVLSIVQYVRNLPQTELGDLQEELISSVFDFPLSWVISFKKYILFCFLGSVSTRLFSLFITLRLRTIFFKASPLSPQPYILSFISQTLFLGLLIYITIQVTPYIERHHFYGYSESTFYHAIASSFSIVLISLLSHISKFLEVTDVHQHKKSALDESESEYNLLIYRYCFEFLFLFTLLKKFPGEIFFTLYHFGQVLMFFFTKRKARQNWLKFVEYVQNLPIATDNSDDVCVVCRESLIGNCKQLSCGHCFHEDCLLRWTSKRMVCPLCNASIDKQGKVSTSDNLDKKNLQQEFIITIGEEIMKEYEHSSLNYINIFE